MLVTREIGKGNQHKRKKKEHNDVNDEIKTHVQSAADEFLNRWLKKVDDDDNRKHHSK